MKQYRLENILILLLLTGVVSLMTGIDQYVHIQICHHTSHCTAESHGTQFLFHHDTDEHNCSLCQFFTCGYCQSLPCDSFDIAIRPAPSLWTMPTETAIHHAAAVSGKTSRAPPAI